MVNPLPESKPWDSAAFLIPQQTSLGRPSDAPRQTVPLPAATQWGLVEQGATLLQPELEQLIWQAAQGEMFHNDDTGMRILRVAREPAASAA